MKMQPVANNAKQNLIINDLLTKLGTRPHDNLSPIPYVHVNETTVIIVIWFLLPADWVEI